MKGDEALRIFVDLRVGAVHHIQGCPVATTIVTGNHRQLKN